MKGISNYVNALTYTRVDIRLWHHMLEIILRGGVNQYYQDK